MFPSPILVTGCSRSGASMIAGALGLCGTFSGTIDGLNRHYENVKIRDQILVPYLKSIDVDVDGQFPLPNTSKLNIPIDFRNQIIAVMKEDGYKTGPWMVKGSRLALTWPLWYYAFPNAKWLIVRRRTGDIIHSCIKTDHMRAFKDEAKRNALSVKTEGDGWKWWVNRYLDLFRTMIDTGLNIKTIWPERMVHGDYEQLFETIDWLGLRWQTKALEFLDPKFFKVRKREGIHIDRGEML